MNVVEFLLMVQNTEEPVTQFLSRLKGQSSVCDFEVKCSQDRCNTSVSYSDKMVSHQLVMGLEDAAIQEKVLALAATEKKVYLQTITEFVIAQETGSRSSKLLGEGVGFRKISNYKRVWSITPPSKLSQDSGDRRSKEKVWPQGLS